MKTKLYKILFPLLFVLCSALVTFARDIPLGNTVERGVRQAALAQEQSAQDYVVHVVAHFKKDNLLKDYMLRAPRRPANPNQIISVSRTQKTCQGVVVSNRTRVVVPEVCVNAGNYALEKVVLRSQTGATLKVAAQDVTIKEDVAWLAVEPAKLGATSFAAFHPVIGSQSLQDAFGQPMTDHLKQFFHARGVVEHRRCRMGLRYSEPRLQLGEPLFYQGKLVALVKERVRTYGGFFGGVSESALAIIR